MTRLPKGRETIATIELLRGLGVTELVAEDVYIENHLHYMERVASEAGARLRGASNGRGPRGAKLHRIIKSGVNPEAQRGRTHTH